MCVLYRYPRLSEANTVVGNTDTNSGVKANPVISQAFVPTSVLRKLHCDKHDQVCDIVDTNVAFNTLHYFQCTRWYLRGVEGRGGAINCSLLRCVWKLRVQPHFILKETFRWFEEGIIVYA